MAELVQKGPRAHHFAALLSVAVGISFVRETYGFNTPSVVLGNFLSIPVSGQDVWGYVMIALGVATLLRFSVLMRAACLVLMTGLWVLYGSIALWGSLFGPMALTTGSYNGIVSMGIAGATLLGVTNLKRDFRPYKRRVDEEG